MNIIVAVLAALVMTSTFTGCHSGGDIGRGDGWYKVEVGKSFSYYEYDSPHTSEKKSLFVVLPGYNGGYEEGVSKSIAAYLNKRRISGSVISPYVCYAGSAVIEFYIKSIHNLIDTYRNTVGFDSLYLAGQSCGSLHIMRYGSEWGADALLPVVAGIPKTDATSPSDELPEPPGSVPMWFLNGFETSTYSKYGILFDGTVYVDPTKRLFERLKGNEVKMTLVPDSSHNKTYKYLQSDDSILDWIVSQ